MEIVRWGLRVVILVAILVGRQRYRYPGGWSFAFSPAYAAERACLARARRELAWRAVRDWGRRTALEVRLNSARAAHRRSVAQAQAALREAEDPGSGPIEGELGCLVVRRHTLAVGDDLVVPLEGLRVGIREGSKSHHLTVVEADGRIHHVPLPREEYEENAVHAFVALIENSVLREKAFLSTQADRIETARARLAKTESDTAHQDSVRAEIQRVARQRRLDPEQAAALARLKAARQKWQDLTGRLPAG
ncbi:MULTISPECIES: hypothetical protein [Streptomyces]|uniref:hypothetical protein n=1 Tax=Streptomyces TaxID=1883 RepID=UPI002F924C3C